ncbi:DUF4261 domain-containing protein [Gemmata sp. JC673]|uniref:DUF4261 domain-containing protein n=1 Tax=Gemmata algarum TaxID=2975278 RepID=A0ABU5EW48_9BACT|nr:DUF4261 domain-containing protein [Gemmata algarum]MDY3558867.1 DUF4261 domain-containing protein [Gemmata algarum]
MADDLLDRFFGKGVPKLGGPPVANPRLRDPLGLQCLFDIPLDLKADAVQAAVRDYHPDLDQATVELFHVPPDDKKRDRPHDLEPAIMGLVAWGPHVIKLVAFANPMPPEAVRACVQPAHFAPEFKEVAYRHQTHVVLFYNGYDQDPLEQYVALAAVAGVLATFGAVFTLNETARTAIPAPVLTAHEEDNGDMLGALRGLPLVLLYCGFVKLEIEGQPGVWMRTYGAHRFGLPDLALHAPDHTSAQFTFELFGNALRYLRTSGQRFAPGHTMQVGDDLFLRLRARTPDEWYLDSEGEMLVAERAAGVDVSAHP